MLDQHRAVRRAIYRHFVATASAPANERIAAEAGIPAHEVMTSLERLADAHMLVLDPRTRAIWMAMPFSAVPTNDITRA